MLAGIVNLSSYQKRKDDSWRPLKGLGPLHEGPTALARSLFVLIPLAFKASEDKDKRAGGRWTRCLWGPFLLSYGGAPANIL